MRDQSGKGWKLDGRVCGGHHAFKFDRNCFLVFVFYSSQY